MSALSTAAVLLLGAAGTAESLDVADVVERCRVILLERQEGAEWPYEGVYRVLESPEESAAAGRKRPARVIPIGYRVGGTGIALLALARAPGYAGDDLRAAAVERATEFLCDSIDHPLMDPDAGDATYDVRGWGYVYGLEALLELKRTERIPERLRLRAEAATRYFLDALQRSEIAGEGGWNYSRPAGFAQPAPSSPFMTAPAVAALLGARAGGYPVDAAVVDRALAALEHSRTDSGSYTYAGRSLAGQSVAPEGAVGRMLCSEVVLLQAGRGEIERIRAALDAFFLHWDWLERRRKQPGTHEPPFGIAPYYFFYAHYHAALAIEALPAAERPPYRARLQERLLAVREPDGSFNDRVFERSASYGTALAALCLLAPQAE